MCKPYIGSATTLSDNVKYRDFGRLCSFKLFTGTRHMCTVDSVFQLFNEWNIIFV